MIETVKGVTYFDTREEGYLLYWGNKPDALSSRYDWEIVEGWMKACLDKYRKGGNCIYVPRFLLAIKMGEDFNLDGATV